VGVTTGSVIVTATVTPTPSAAAVAGSDPTMAAASSALTTAIASGALGTIMNGNIGGFMGATATMYVLPSDSTTTSTSSTNVGLIVGVVVGGVFLMTAIVITFVYCIRKRSRVVQSLEQEEYSHDKEAEKNSYDFEPSGHKIEVKLEVDGKELEVYS